jgi:hypothetical protein
MRFRHRLDTSGASRPMVMGEVGRSADRRLCVRLDEVEPASVSLHLAGDPRHDEVFVPRSGASSRSSRSARICPSPNLARRRHWKKP